MVKAFDASSKQLFEQYTRDWLALLGWPVPPTDAGLAMVDSDLSTVSPAADKLVRVDAVPDPYLAHVEFQTTGDHELDGRMLQYNVLARARHGRPVRSVVYLFRPSAAAGPTGRVSDQGDDQSWLEFSYRMVRLWEWPAEQLLTGPLGTVPLAPLSTSPTDLPAVLDRIRQRFQAEANRNRAADVMECVRQLLGLRFGDTFAEVIMPTSLQQLVEEESWTYRQTVQKGRAAGLAEGRAEGQSGTLRGAVIVAGTARFGPHPADVAEQLAKVHDASELTGLLVRAATASGWHQVLAG